MFIFDHIDEICLTDFNRLIENRGDYSKTNRAIADLQSEAEMWFYD